MTGQKHLPGMEPGLAFVRYDNASPYVVTIAEYFWKDGEMLYSGREWTRNTAEKTVTEWLKELDLRITPF